MVNYKSLCEILLTNKKQTKLWQEDYKVLICYISNQSSALYVMYSINNHICLFSQLYYSVYHENSQVEFYQLSLLRNLAILSKPDVSSFKLNSSESLKSL